MLRKAANGTNELKNTRTGEVHKLRLKTSYVKSRLGADISAGRLARLRCAPGKYAIYEKDSSTWIVWGGESVHELKAEDGSIHCDCGKPCVHTWLVELYLSGVRVIKVKDESKIGHKPVKELLRR